MDATSAVVCEGGATGGLEMYLNVLVVLYSTLYCDTGKCSSRLTFIFFAFFKLNFLFCLRFVLLFADVVLCATL